MTGIGVQHDSSTEQPGWTVAEGEIDQSGFHPFNWVHKTPDAGEAMEIAKVIGAGWRLPVFRIEDDGELELIQDKDV